MTVTDGIDLIQVNAENADLLYQQGLLTEAERTKLMRDLDDDVELYNLMYGDAEEEED